MNRRELLSYAGVAGVSVGGFAAYQNGLLSSLFTQATGGGSDDPARREFGATTTGVAAIEWQDDGKLRVESKEDATWQGIVVETNDDEWIASGNKDPTDQEVVLNPLSHTDSVLPEDHKLRIVDRELNRFEFQEIEWTETITLDFGAKMDAEADYNVDDEVLEITIENTGPCAIRGERLEIETDGGSVEKSVSGSVTPGDTETLTAEKPWPESETACSSDGTEYSGKNVVTPAVDAEISYTVEIPEDKSCTTIPG